MSTLKTNRIENTAGTAGFDVATIPDGGGFSMRNKLINGGFDIWQRGELGIGSNGYYSADRWKNSFNTSPINMFTSKTVVSDSRITSKNGIRAHTNTINVVSPNVVYLLQLLETHLGNSDGSPKKITISFWYRARSSHTATINEVDVGLGGSTISFSPTLSWQKFTHTLTTDVASRLSFAFANGAVDVELTEVQLEEGTVATPFEQRPIGMELALCQRYYETIDMNWRGYAAIAGQYIRPRWFFAVQKRNFPAFTVIEGAASGMTYNGTNQNIDPEGIDIDLRSSNTGGVFYYARYIADAEL